MTTLTRRTFVAAAALTGAAILTSGAQPSRRPLAPADVDAIVRLVALEDTRQFDRETLAALARSAHREVRRRAIVSIGRIVHADGRALLAELRTDPDPEIVATVAFATGQLKDPEAVAWLSQSLTGPSAVGVEAARALGKIRSPEAWTALSQFLGSASLTPATAPVIGEALLSSGRFTERNDVAPIVKWTTAANEDVRWRAAWALFRPRNPAAVPHLLKLAEDRSPEVRFWAMRGLTPELVTQAGLDLATVSSRLRTSLRDADRRVRTEALRSLVLYDDDASVAASLTALDSSDSRMAVSAAEQMGRLKSRADLVVPKLVAAASPSRPLSVRLSSLAPLVTLSPEAAATAAAALAREKSEVARQTARQTLQKLGEVGRPHLAGLDETTAKPEAPAARPAAIKRSDEDYRRIVERWVVTAYDGRPPVRAVLTTPRGEIEVALHGGDAPLGAEHFVTLIESGAIVGTEFGRVVPNFVAQQRPIRGAALLRDEVSRLGLTRGNVSWASSGLDTGRPGYTFGSTPQPHNEGDFTALARVVRGIEVVDRLELGDAITGARLVK